MQMQILGMQAHFKMLQNVLCKYVNASKYASVKSH